MEMQKKETAQRMRSQGTQNTAHALVYPFGLSSADSIGMRQIRFALLAAMTAAMRFCFRSAKALKAFRDAHLQRVFAAP